MTTPAPDVRAMWNAQTTHLLACSAFRTHPLQIPRKTLTLLPAARTIPLTSLPETVNWLDLFTHPDLAAQAASVMDGLGDVLRWMMCDLAELSCVVDPELHANQQRDTILAVKLHLQGHLNAESVQQHPIPEHLKDLIAVQSATPTGVQFMALFAGVVGHVVRNATLTEQEVKATLMAVLARYQQGHCHGKNHPTGHVSPASTPVHLE